MFAVSFSVSHSNLTSCSHFGRIWDNVNIELQYNFVGTDYLSPVPPEAATRRDFRLLRRGKSFVATHPGPSAIGRNDSEMIGSMRSQGANVGSNIPVGVPSLSLVSRGMPITSRGAPLETNSCAQPMRVQGAMENR